MESVFKEMKKLGVNYNYCADELYKEQFIFIWPNKGQSLKVKNLNNFLKEYFNPNVFVKDLKCSARYLEVECDEHPSYHVLILVQRDCSDSLQLSAMSHESNHCALNALYLKGMRLDGTASSEEPFCYYQEFILRHFIQSVFPSLR